jgi:hypothetical protein
MSSRMLATGGHPGHGPKPGATGDDERQNADDGLGGLGGAGCPLPAVGGFQVSEIAVNLTSGVGQDVSQTVTITNVSSQAQTLVIPQLTGNFFSFPHGEVVFQPGEHKDCELGHSAMTKGTETVKAQFKLTTGLVVFTVTIIGVTK